jgi:hypothetical protein
MTSNVQTNIVIRDDAWIITHSQNGAVALEIVITAGGVLEMVAYFVCAGWNVER